jgi:type I restriction enzyme, S subunit
MNIEMKAEGGRQEAEDLKVDDKLPQGWAIANIQELCQIQTGKKDVNQGNPNGQYYFFTCASEPLRSDDYIFDGESILLPGNGANVGLVLYYKGKFDLYQRTYALTNFFINGRYLYFYFLANWKNSLIDKQYGSATNYIRLGNITEFSVQIAPLNEQKRIVAKLEKLLAKVNESCDRLSRIPTILKRFRQSVLASACSGRLTNHWRKSHPNIEPVEKLLKRIQEDRLDQAKTPAQKSKIQEIYLSEETEHNESLPESWNFVTLNKLCISFDYGTSQKSLKEGKVPVLRMGNIQDGEIDWDDLVYSCDKDEIIKYNLYPNTVLFNRTNSAEKVGKTAIYRGDRPAIFAGYLIRINNCPELDPEYLNYCLNTPYAKSYCNSVKSDGVNQSNINAQKLAKFEIPFCTIEEQKEIVKRVKALLRKCDLIEQRYLKAKAYTDKLTQSILAKAFRGELVPQYPNDEPAEVLLERIREEKTLTEKSSKGNRKTTKSI